MNMYKYICISVIEGANDVFEVSSLKVAQPSTLGSGDLSITDATSLPSADCVRALFQQTLLLCSDAPRFEPLAGNSGCLWRIWNWWTRKSVAALVSWHRDTLWPKWCLWCFEGWARGSREPSPRTGLSKAIFGFNDVESRTHAFPMVLLWLSHQITSNHFKSQVD